MPLVTVTYNAWDHNREIIPTNLQPRVGFRPLSSSKEQGLMTPREVWGSGPTGPNGAGSVELESTPGILYVPFMMWLIDEYQATEAVPNRAFGYCEWEPIYPGSGGPISELPEVVNLTGVWYGYGEPPAALENSTYLDITGPGVGIWVPEHAVFSEGVVV